MGLLLFLIFNYLFFFNVREEEEKKVRLGKGLEIWNEIYNKKKKKETNRNRKHNRWKT